MDTKRRRKFVGYIQTCESKSKACEGLLYDEGNVQVLWRSDIGWTAEQFDSVARVFDLLPGLNRVDIGGYHEDD